MLKGTLRTAKPAHISLTLVGLMWVFPFLYHDHPLPIPSFYAEWIAAILGLCALVPLAVTRHQRPLAVPYTTLLPLALAMLITVQFAIGKGNYPEQSILYALYLIWAAMLIVLGRQLREELGLPFLATTLALFLLVGAELSALVGILQHYSINTILGITVVMSKDFPEITANLAQPNSLANYLMLGLVSLGLLYGRWKMHIWLTLFLAMPLLFVLALTGSRSSWLYLMGIGCLALLWYRRDKSNMPLLGYSLLLMLGFGLMQVVARLPLLEGAYGNVTSAQRMVGAAAIPVSDKVETLESVATAYVAEGDVVAVEAGGVAFAITQGSIRLAIWREAWLMFAQHPLLGVGFGRFGTQHFMMGPELRDSTLSNLNDYVEHAHNLFLHIAAETGLAGLSILVGLLGMWLLHAFCTPRTNFHWWGYAVLMVLAIHSMLEYPLWYAFFLGLAAVALGVFDESSFRMPSRGYFILAGRWALLVTLLAGIGLASWTLQDFRRLVALQASMPGEQMVENDYLHHARSELLAMRERHTLLMSYVERLLSEAQWDHIADKRALNERVMGLTPAREVAWREVLLLARAGAHDEARKQIERVIWTYPAASPEFIRQLERLALIDPDPLRFPVLLNFAQQKYLEWQRMTSKKS